MDKKMTLDYNPTISIGNIAEILTKRFPEYKQKKQTWGVNAPFIILEKSFFVRAIIFIKQRPKKHQTIIGINGGMSPIAFVLFGFFFHCLFRGNFLNEVYSSIQEELS